ncbi:MAG TPA: redoxin domain-containing protein [Terracidiphilus sp.]|nr:redoxin domain-containing protein [Terracidiphilus sp.]
MPRVSYSSYKACLAITILLFAPGLGLHASGAPTASNPKPGEPTDPKARKTFAGAVEFQKKGQKQVALGEFRKANTQDGGHCVACLSRAYSLAMETGAYKEAESVLRDFLPLAQTDAAKAPLHFQLAVALQREGLSTKKDNYFTESCDEYRTALQLDSSLALAHYGLGASLAQLHQDDTARAEFKAFLDQDKDNPAAHPRAQRYADRIELARAKMAPPFSVVALDGRHVSMDELAGKVVLIDFWATWCGPCLRALPRIRGIAQKFYGQPLVVLSISLDSDEAKWKNFVSKNEMTWLQYRDGHFNGPIATLFAVKAIPATFSIDADGVLEDQHIGDADIEGKLKKLISQAVESSNRKAASAATIKASGAAN